MTPCSHSHSTRSGVLWPVRLSHTSNSCSGGRWSGRVKGLVRPACHTALAACVAAGSSEACGTGNTARMSLRRSRSHGCRTALVPRAAADVFVRLLGRGFARLPGYPGMRHGLERPGLVLAPDRQPKLGAERVSL